MLKRPHSLIATAFVVFLLPVGAQAPSTPAAGAQGPPGAGFPRQMQDSNEIVNLTAIHAQDVDIYPDEKTKTYYMIASGGGGVRAWTSKDLINWQGPKFIYRTPPDVWGDIATAGIWAPELHEFKGKYYLFLTFNSRHLLQEQWHDWRPRVTRGSQILWSDSPEGPYYAFAPHSTTPPDMMTLDGTLWVEDGVPYMVFCNEWVQVLDGTIESMPLKEDLSAAAGPPKRLFRGSQAKWSELIEGAGYVTDGPYLWMGKTGKLYLIWSSRAADQSYKLGIAISDSGKLAGPWRQQDQPIFSDNGGHGMIFKTFDGKLMLMLHAPDGHSPQPHLFTIEDTGETLRILKEVTGTGP